MVYTKEVFWVKPVVVEIVNEGAFFVEVGGAVPSKLKVTQEMNVSLTEIRDGTGLRLLIESSLARPVGTPFLHAKISYLQLATVKEWVDTLNAYIDHSRAARQRRYRELGAPPIPLQANPAQHWPTMGTSGSSSDVQVELRPPKDSEACSPFEPRTLRLHKGILVPQSKFFEGLFAFSPQKELIQIETPYPDSFQHMVSMMYGKMVNVRTTAFYELLSLADEFQVEGVLKAMMTPTKVRSVTLALGLLSHPVCQGDSDFFSSTASFVGTRLNEVHQNDNWISLDFESLRRFFQEIFKDPVGEFEKINALASWVEADESRAEQIGPVLRFVRLWRCTGLAIVESLSKTSLYRLSDIFRQALNEAMALLIRREINMDLVDPLFSAPLRGELIFGSVSQHSTLRAPSLHFRSTKRIFITHLRIHTLKNPLEGQIEAPLLKLGAMALTYSFSIDYRPGATWTWCDVVPPIELRQRTFESWNLAYTGPATHLTALAPGPIHATDPQVSLNLPRDYTEVSVLLNGFAWRYSFEPGIVPGEALPARVPDFFYPQ